MSPTSVFFADWNGITRVTAPAKLKTAAVRAGVVRLACSATQALVQRAHNNNLLYDVALEPAEAQGSTLALLPGGGVVALEGRALRLGKALLPMGTPAQDLGEIELGPRRAGGKNRYEESFLAVGADESFALWTQEGAVTLGRIDRAAGRAHVDATLRLLVGGGASFAVLPGPGGAVFAALDLAGPTLYVAHLGAHGMSSVSQFPALTLPLRDGDGLVYQRDVATVVRATLEGAPTAQLEIPESERGPGELGASAGELWFLPRYRETLADLVRNKVVARKLPAKTAAPREGYQRLLRAVDALGAGANLRVTLASLSFSSGSRSSFTPHWYFSSGDGSVRALVTWGLATSAHVWLPFADAAWPGGFSGGQSGSRGFYGRRSDLGELLSVLADLDAQGLRFMHAWRQLESAYSDSRGAVFTPEAESLALFVLLRAIDARDASSHGAVVERWRAAPLEPEQLVALFAPLYTLESWGPGDRGLYGIEALLTEMIASQFGARALPALEHLAEVSPTPFALANVGYRRAALERLRAKLVR